MIKFGGKYKLSCKEGMINLIGEEFLIKGKYYDVCWDCSDIHGGLSDDHFSVIGEDGCPIIFCINEFDRFKNNPYYGDYFYTLNEIRQLKLEKLIY
jgi:hypothetical protein